MKSRLITFDEQKQIQFTMLQEIDSFCRVNGIRYSLAFGTLLGSIRHRGYIPWDDDIDIMMPLPDLLRFKHSFKSEKLKYCDVDSEEYYLFPFSRVAHKDTFKKRGICLKSYGICIDIYPIITLPDTVEEQEVFFRNAETLQKKRLFYVQLRSFLIKVLPIKTIIGFNRKMKRYRDYILLSNKYYEGKQAYYIIAGPLSLREKMTYNKDLFCKMTTGWFEGKEFPIIAEYDYFLSLRYGDYMLLPPENQRHPYHGDKFYWRIK